jgi:Lon protease-like protein
MEAKVQSLPLFPLQAVLIPGQTMPLHIFEPRYRVMIQQCVDQKEPFGLVLAWEPDTPVEIGTTARVTEVKKFADGTSNIVTVGEERFKIQSIRVSEHGYLIGDVISFPLTGDAGPDLVSEVSRQTRKYLKYLSETNGVRFRFEHFPQAGPELALFTAIALRAPVELKQDLLSAETVTDMLETELVLLREENRHMFLTATAIVPPQDDSGFSPN